MLERAERKRRVIKFYVTWLWASGDERDESHVSQSTAKVKLVWHNIASESSSTSHSKRAGLNQQPTMSLLMSRLVKFLMISATSRFTTQRFSLIARFV
jgi:hypothetical protein